MQWPLPQATRRRCKILSGPQITVFQVIIYIVFDLSVSGSFQMWWRAKRPWTFCCLVSLIRVDQYILERSPFPLSFAFFVIFGIHIWKTCASLGTNPLKQTTLKLSKQPDCCDLQAAQALWNASPRANGARLAEEFLVNYNRNWHLHISMLIPRRLVQPKSVISQWGAGWGDKYRVEKAWVEEGKDRQKDTLQALSLKMFS